VSRRLQLLDQAFPRRIHSSEILRARLACDKLHRSPAETRVHAASRAEQRHHMATMSSLPRILPLVVIIPMLEFLNGCPPAAYGNLACPELSGGAANAKFSAEAKGQATIKAFVTASGDLSRLAVQIEEEVAAACVRIGTDLGIPAEQLAPRQGNGGKAEGACTPVAARIDAILQEGVSARIDAKVTPPECRVEASAYASCAGECQANVDPGYVVAHCEPGKLSGTCEGKCVGACEGTCTGSCAGNCSARNAAGQCAGACDGTCEGRCDATCHARCEGTWQAPRCEADVKGPSVDAKCEASCKAEADFRAQCSEARVELSSSVNTGQMPQLIATLSRNLPILVRAQIAYGKRLAGSIQTLVEVGADMPKAVADATTKGVACMAAAANATVSAQASIQVSVRASASVSAKANAG
jgi:hypothetical protein